VTYNPFTVPVIFFGRLFSQRPDLRARFPEDMGGVHFRFGQFMEHLRAEGVDKTALLALGKKHAGVAITEEDWDAFGEAFMYSLGYKVEFVPGGHGCAVSFPNDPVVVDALRTWWTIRDTMQLGQREGLAAEQLELDW
jgi:hypothetical protein